MTETSAPPSTTASPPPPRQPLTAWLILQQWSHADDAPVDLAALVMRDERRRA